ncbi:MAG: phosphohistidine phosphatase SixA [Rhodospirillales bacterium]|jgi:phosphohistidine phosphatase|nr:phosphohistidine phosphatase SixA [Rhodospirillales bacterium]
MKLYLMQHGEALPAEENAERPLSEKGLKDVGRLAVFLARSRVKLVRVIHSGKARALATALAMAEVIGPGREVEQAESGLAPNDNTDQLATVADALNEDFMVVGHLPFLGRMASRLLTGNEEAAKIAFTPGTVACLERGDDGTWSLNWVVRPELLGV